MVYVIVDVETTGPIPHKYEMTSFGAVVVDANLDNRFYSKIGDKRGYQEKVDENVKVETPFEAMVRFNNWLSSVKNQTKGEDLIFVSDNPGFDWQFINYYFHHYLDGNPFGFSSRSIGDLYAGLKKDCGLQNEWRQFCITPHTHNPLDDAVGHAEAFIKMFSLGLQSSKISVPGIDFGVKLRQTDWWCVNCNFVVFGKKDKCLKCGGVKNPNCIIGNLPVEMQRKFLNDNKAENEFKRDEVRKEDERIKKPNNISFPCKPQHPFSKKNRDWMCNICNVLIFGSKDECRKCHSKRP